MTRTWLFLLLSLQLFLAVGAPPIKYGAGDPPPPNGGPGTEQPSGGR